MPSPEPTPAPAAEPTPAATTERRRSNESFPAYILIAVLIWLILTPDDNSGVLPLGDVGSKRLEHEKYGLQVLQNVSWGAFAPQLDTAVAEPAVSRLRLRDDLPANSSSNLTLTEEEEYIGQHLGFLNLTGFRKGDNYSWQGLNEFRSKCSHHHREASLSSDSHDETWGLRDVPVWHNMSGVVTGGWTRSSVTGASRKAMDYNLTQLSSFVDWLKPDEDWGWNMTESSTGTMKLTFYDRLSKAIGNYPVSDDTKDLDPAKMDMYRATPLFASVSVEDESNRYEMWDMTMHGLHWPVYGAVLLSTTSDKFDGIFALPLLAPTKEMFLAGRHALNASVTQRLVLKEDEIFSDPRIPWGADDYGNAFSPLPQCEYIMFLQLLPPDKNKLFRGHPGHAPQHIFDEIERELRFPQGAPMPHVPPLQMSAVIYSPDCGFYMESIGPPAVPLAEGRHFIGLKAPVVKAQINQVLLGLFFVLSTQLALIKRQMRESSTPSTLGRVSFFTICIMAIADGLLMMFIMVFLLTSHSSMVVVSLVFVSMMTTVMAMVFVYKVFHTQLPDRVRERERARALAAASVPPAPPVAPESEGPILPMSTPQLDAASVSSTAVDDTASSPDTTSRVRSPSPDSDDGRENDSLLPNTHRPVSPPIIIPSDQDIDSEIQEQIIGPPPQTAAPANATNTGANAVSTTGFTTLNFTHVIRCILLFAVILIIVLLSTFAQRRSIRAIIFNTLSLLYLSLWFPQIYRNISRNSRRALSWEFMIGQSVCRLIPLAYLYTVNDNALLLHTDRYAFAVFAGLVWLQLWLLAAQDFLGARIGVPKSWFPEGWDYHPILREDGLENGPLPIGIAEAPLKVSTSSVSSAASINSSSPLMPGESSGGQPSRAECIRLLDCAICREDLELPVLPAGEKDVAGVAGVFARRAYMVTPCGHVFHTQCLEGWMRFRLQCPNCREDLPPL